MLRHFKMLTPRMPARHTESVGRLLCSFQVRCPRARLLVSAVLLAQLASLARANDTANVVSPRLQALRAAVETGDDDAVPAFWNEIKQQGTPLVEKIPENAAGGSVGDVWLTFLWQGDDTTRNVVLAGGLPMGHPYDNRFSLLPGCDVWYLTLRVRNDLRAGYYLSVNDPLTSPDFSDDEALKERASRLRKDPWNPRKHMSGSLVELAHAPPQPWTKSRADVPDGTLHAEKFHSALLDNDRTVTVYRPPRTIRQVTPTRF